MSTTTVFLEPAHPLQPECLLEVVLECKRFEEAAMADVDKEAAKQELDKAAQLQDRADELAEVADELRHQAQSLERDAAQLVAPEKLTASRR
jgi:hypothetical protein